MNPLVEELQNSILPAAKIFSALEKEHRVQLVLLGGAAVPFYIDPENLTSYRRTKDIDVVVAATNYSEFMRVENLLREHKLINDTERDASPFENRLAFRWWLGDLCIDILSTHDVRFGNDVRWLGSNLEYSYPYIFRDGTRIQLADAPAFIATKLDAFFERGKSDFFESRDLEDILTVIDGRSTLENEFVECDHALREYLRTEFRRFLENRDYLAAVEGQFPDQPSRAEELMKRSRIIAGSTITGI